MIADRLKRIPVFISDDEFVEGVVGYRAWFPVDTVNGVMLRAVTYDQIWDPVAPTVASCWFEDVAKKHGWENPHAHEVPGHGDRCGLHAYPSVAQLRADQPELLCLFGEVALWGNVAIHERGIRAKYGRVTAIHWPKELWATMPNLRMKDLALRAADTYNVPIIKPQSQETP